MKSTLKTTAAVLRSISGETDSAWADILGKSVHTIRHLEAGTLKLSAALAAKMNYESGISIQWLMDGDPTAPPVSAAGQEYTKAIYDLARARQKDFATVKDDDVRNKVGDALRIICAILVNANRKRKFHLAIYRTAKALTELRDEFGEAKDFASYEAVWAFVRIAFEGWPVHPPPSARQLQKIKLVDLSPSPSKPKSKPPSKKRRRKAVDSNTFRRASVSPTRGSAQR